MSARHPIVQNSPPPKRGSTDLGGLTALAVAQGGFMARPLSHGHCRTLEIVFLALAGACTYLLTMLWFGSTPTGL